MKRNLFALVMLVAISALFTACNRSSDNPNSPGPVPTGPGFPPGIPVVPETRSGQMGPDSPATCEPVLNSQICDSVTFTPQNDGAMQYMLSWSPAEAGAVNRFALVGEYGRVDILATEPIPSRTTSYFTGPTKKGQTYKVSAYLLPGGQGKSSYTLEVKHSQ